MADLTFREGEAIVPKCLSRGVICQVKWTTAEPYKKVLQTISLSVGVQVYPLHHPSSLDTLQRTWVQSLFALQPLGQQTSQTLYNRTVADKISEYFGVKIGFYFAWLGHYTSALTVPAIVGLLFWVKPSILWSKLLTVTFADFLQRSSRICGRHWICPVLLFQRDLGNTVPGILETAVGRALP